MLRQDRAQWDRLHDLQRLVFVEHAHAERVLQFEVDRLTRLLCDALRKDPPKRITRKIRYKQNGTVSQFLCVEAIIIFSYLSAKTVIPGHF